MNIKTHNNNITVNRLLTTPSDYYFEVPRHNLLVNRDGKWTTYLDGETATYLPNYRIIYNAGQLSAVQKAALKEYVLDRYYRYIVRNIIELEVLV